MVSRVGANQARARKAALNEGLQPEPSSSLAPTDQLSSLPASAATPRALPRSCSPQTSTPSCEPSPATTRSHPTMSAPTTTSSSSENQTDPAIVE